MDRRAFLWLTGTLGTLAVPLAPQAQQQPGNVYRLAGDYDWAFAAMRGGQADAVLVQGTVSFNRDRQRIIALAAKHRLPAIYEWRHHAEADGGPMAYGSNIVDLSQRVASYVDRIFKGAPPADLPVEQPTKFELVINLKTAKALGLTIPQSLLVRADEIIE